ncbi:hypothetical protein OE903_08575 [Bacillus sp. B6(2022)]|nr:hypothetical protein [Bacillus sp. B6(2022)]
MYLRQDAEHIKRIFHFLESSYAYPDIEELALDTAKYYNEMEDYEKSSMFYGEAEHARIYIQRGIVYMNFKKWAVVCTSITILALWITSPNADPDNRNHTLEKPNPQHITI